MEEKDLLQNSCGGFPYPVTTQGELEKEANHIPKDEHLEARMMYLDLLGYIR